eukprot:NODE_693_length_668_cov_325.946396_g684_i0.p1 GENE.NODE_693_length_668_cov_325.946396_g684_i0~~NODE_693_length_668_cov_325.946396_g684_i0.p1  ORF type:complete len:132 (-),score=40.88 NODE_693_length_668_cov_325.946396_g684_i0:217-612(-)
MFNKHTDISPEGPNPYIRKIGNHLYHKDEIPKHIRYNDQRRDKEVLDNLRNIWSHSNQAPIVTDQQPPQPTFMLPAAQPAAALVPTQTVVPGATVFPGFAGAYPAATTAYPGYGYSAGGFGGYGGGYGGFF